MNIIVVCNNCEKELLVKDIIFTPLQEIKIKVEDCNNCKDCSECEDKKELEDELKAFREEVQEKDDEIKKLKRKIKRYRE